MPSTRKPGRNAADPAKPVREDLAESAAQLGITPRRVLQEYARIAFADLRNVAEWGPGHFVLRACESLSEADAAAIAELVSLGDSKSVGRVRLHNKKSALDAIARFLGMFDRVPLRPQDGASPVAAEDPREVIVRRLARLAAGAAEERTASDAVA